MVSPARSTHSETREREGSCLPLPIASAHSLLPQLTTAKMEPLWQCQVPNVSSFLQRIDHIQVTRVPTRDEYCGAPIYAVQVYYEEPTSRIPTISTNKSINRPVRPARDRSLKPSLQVEHTVKHFSSLRDAVHSCAQGGRKGCSCEFCMCLNIFFTFGRARPLAFANLPMNTNNDASDLFELLLCHLLDRCRSLFDSGRAGLCRGQRHIPFLLYSFLQPSRQDT